MVGPDEHMPHVRTIAELFRTAAPDTIESIILGMPETHDKILTTYNRLAQRHERLRSQQRTATP